MYLVDRNRTDRLVGTEQSDYAWGGDGDDTITGGGGDDRILCGSGRDVADGGDGNDFLDAGTGGGTLSGGGGADTFRFGYRPNLPDRPGETLVVTDFDPLQGDRLAFAGSAKAAAIVAAPDGSGYVIHFDCGIGAQDWAAGSEVFVRTTAGLAAFGAALDWGA
jgi:Ca2+-binding RTX toxin-like protein